MYRLHVKLRDGYRHKGIWVVVCGVQATSLLCLFIGSVIQHPRTWWMGLLYLGAVPYLVLWPGLPGHLTWMQGRSAHFSALFTHLQFAAAGMLLARFPMAPAQWRLPIVLIILACFVAGATFAALGTGYVGAYWKLTTGRVRAYLDSHRWKHPMEVLLRRAMTEGRDLYPEERLAWEVYLANRMLEQGEYAPPAGVSRMHQIRVRAAAERIRNETEAAASALGRMRIARLERVMSQQPPRTQEG